MAVTMLVFYFPSLRRPCGSKISGHWFWLPAEQLWSWQLPGAAGGITKQWYHWHKGASLPAHKARLALLRDAGPFHGDMPRERNGSSPYPGNQKLITRSCFAIPAGNPRPAARLMMVHGLIASSAPAHLLGWQPARSQMARLIHGGRGAKKKDGFR